MKPLSPTAETSIRAKIIKIVKYFKKIGKNHALTEFWCCMTVYERLTLEVVLTYGLANWLKSVVLAAKYPCGMFLQKNNSLGELRHQRFIAFLLVGWVCYSFMPVRGVVHGEDHGFELNGSWTHCSEVWQGK